MDDTRPTRRAPRVVLALLGVLVVTGLVATFAGGRGAGAQCPEERVAVPAAGAGPTEVVTAYVAALDKCDIGTARALSTPEHSKRTEETEDSWYRNVDSIENLAVDDPIRDERPGLHSTVFVRVQFDLRQRRPLSMPDGRTEWGYVVARASADARWLVVDDGPA